MYGDYDKEELGFGGGVIASFIMIILVYLMTIIPSWLWHASDRADLSQIDNLIAINQTEYDNAAKIISGLSEGTTQLRLNADSPVSSMVAAQISISERLVAAKEKKITLIARIISRCNGPWKPIVWMADDVTCDEYRKL